jgi:hypothetical protein
VRTDNRTTAPQLPKPPSEGPEAFLRRQDGADVTTALLELANEHDDVRARLARMQLAGWPDKLAACFKTTLSGWRRSTRFLGDREAHEDFEAEIRARHGRKSAFWLVSTERVAAGTTTRTT